MPKGVSWCQLPFQQPTSASPELVTGARRGGGPCVRSHSQKGTVRTLPGCLAGEEEAVSTGRAKANGTPVACDSGRVRQAPKSNTMGRTLLLTKWRRGEAQEYRREEAGSRQQDSSRCHPAATHSVQLLSLSPKNCTHQVSSKVGWKPPAHSLAPQAGLSVPRARQSWQAFGPRGAPGRQAGC